MVDQKQQVLTMLQRARGGVCGTRFLDAHIPRYSARIAELRDQGLRIDRVSCVDPWHRTRQWRYVLIG